MRGLEHLLARIRLRLVGSLARSQGHVVDDVVRVDHYRVGAAVAVAAAAAAALHDTSPYDRESRDCCDHRVFAAAAAGCCRRRCSGKPPNKYASYNLQHQST